uniref:RNA-binding protein 14 n=1 Tax=Tetraodon nigroviridis TaxID=99883 RepID=H3BW06_TETNG
MSGDNVKLFVGNLPIDATQDELNKLFAPYGEINTCSLLRQYAFVTLRGEGAADRAIRHLDGKEYRGRPLVVEESRARPPNSTKVFVGNISATCSADDLHGLFATFGRVLDCDKVKARLCSNVGYAFVHMERKEEALAAIDALNGTMFKGRQLAVELSKAQPLVNQMGSGGNSGGLLPRPALSIEHQSQAAVLAAAAAAAAGLPIQVQQSVHNSFFNTTSFDPTYAALKGITSSKGADGMIYGALASQVYGSVADQVYQDITNHDTTAHVEEVETPAGPDPTVLFEAARAKFFQEGQKILAEQQAGKKTTAAATVEPERDRSPIRGSRTPLLPDPVPGSFAQTRPKRRALLPTPSGGLEESPPATNPPEGVDPVARWDSSEPLVFCLDHRSYTEYFQYAYTNPPPPPPPPASTQAPESCADTAPPGTYSAPPTYNTSASYPPPAYEQTPAHGQSVPQRNDYPYHTPEPPYR